MIPKICALGILLAFVGFLLSEMGFKGKRAFALLSSVIILISLVSELGEIFAETTSLFEKAGVDKTAKAALKIVGLGYVFGISADVAEQLGEAGISKALAIFGRVEIFAMTLPYLKEIMELGINLIK